MARNAKDNLVSYYHFDCMNQTQPEPGPWEGYIHKFMQGERKWIKSKTGSDLTFKWNFLFVLSFYPAPGAYSTSQLLTRSTIFISGVESMPFLQCHGVPGMTTWKDTGWRKRSRTFYTSSMRTWKRWGEDVDHSPTPISLLYKLPSYFSPPESSAWSGAYHELSRLVRLWWGHQ